MDTISVANLGKAYKQYPTHWLRLTEWLTPGHRPRHSLKWVIQDVSFTVKPGEAVGIIGINGAGKSTLLKMIAGTTQPTTGSVHINGRVAAMLELGMGFHPEFSGRQNALMAGQLVGLAQHEIEKLLPDIEQFADVGEYFDQPVRVYSSGMQARVAFAVATATTPDVLIVDEALSVGDMAFQAKCMQRMHALLERGTTILFVSHGLNQVRQFCSKALYLANGHVRAWGAAEEVCDLYLNDLAGATRCQQAARTENAPSLAEPDKPNYERDPSLRKNSVNGSAGGSMNLEFIAFQVLNFAGQPVSSCSPGDKISFKAIVTANKEVAEGAAVGLLVADKTGYPLLACNSNYYDARLPKMNPGDVAVMVWGVEWPFYSGEFRIDIGIKPDPDGAEFYDRVFCVKTLVTTTPVELIRRNFGGYLHIHADVQVSLISHI